ncbi:hypothetical protein D3C87_2143170 [compost metagenome]
MDYLAGLLTVVYDHSTSQNVQTRRHYGQCQELQYRKSNLHRLRYRSTHCWNRKW